MMLVSLCAAVVKRLAGQGRPQAERRRPAPALEALEDRCLLSEATVASPFNGFPDTPNKLQEAALLPKNNPPVVFLGDSITWGYDYGFGAPAWAATWGAVGAADYGVIGLSTQNVLWQLEAGQLVGTSPFVVVLTIGTNNLLLDGDTPQDTAAGVLADVQAIHLAAPFAGVVVVGMTGGPTPTDPYRIGMSQTNALVGQELAGDPRVVFADVAPALTQPDGTISSAILFDYVHPSTLGYVILGDTLIPSMYEAMLKGLAADMSLV